MWGEKPPFTANSETRYFSLFLSTKDSKKAKKKVAFPSGVDSIPTQNVFSETVFICLVKCFRMCFFSSLPQLQREKMLIYVENPYSANGLVMQMGQHHVVAKDRNHV